MTAYGYNATTGHPLFRDSDAPDIKGDPQAVATYAGQVGTRLIGTSAQRTAYAYARTGLRWFDTTIGGELVHNGTGWVGRSVGTFGADGNATVVSARLSKDEFGVVTLFARTQRTGNTTYETNLILGVLPTGFRPVEDWFGHARVYGTGAPRDVDITASNGIVQLQSPAPAGNTVARVEAYFPTVWSAGL